MAASYHARGTSNQPPHYRTLACDSENLHPGFAPSWHHGNEHSDLWRVSGSSPASLQPRRTWAHGEDIHHQSGQSSRPANNSPYFDSSAWSNDLWNDEIAQRSIVQHGNAQPEAAVSFISQDPTHQHHRASRPAYGPHLNQSKNVLRYFQQLETRPSLIESPAPAIAPEPLPITARRSAPMAHLLDHHLQESSRLHIQPPQLSTPTLTGWPNVSQSDLSIGPQQHPNLPAFSLNSSSDPQWIMSSEANSFATPIFENGLPQEAFSSNEPYRHHIPQIAPISATHYGPPSHPYTSLHTYRPGNSHTDSTSQSAVSKCKYKQKLPKMASSMTPRQIKNKISKREKALTPEAKQNAALMRKIGVCIRCKLYKVACDTGSPCKRCNTAAPGARLYKEPCYRDNLCETNLVRHCNGRLGQPEAEFVKHQFIDGSCDLPLDFMWSLPGSSPLPNSDVIYVQVRQYIPGQHDDTVSVWCTRDGEINKTEQPAYAVTDTAALISTLERYFLNVQPSIELWLRHRIRHDEIASRTFEEVIRLRNKGNSELLQLVMQIQCLSIVSQGYGTVQSNNVPGIKLHDYRGIGLSEYEAYNRDSCDRPLPTGMALQIDVALRKGLKNLEKNCIKELSKQIFKPKIKPWYELFLAFYVLFWNLDYIHQGAEKYIMSKHGTSTEIQVNSIVSSQIKKWDISFPILMQYWPAVLRGFEPFHLARENPDALRQKGYRLDGEERAELDVEGLDYVVEMSRIFDRMGPNQLPPPLTGHASTQHSMGSEWIVKLFKTAGA